MAAQFPGKRGRETFATWQGSSVFNEGRKGGGEGKREAPAFEGGKVASWGEKRENEIVAVPSQRRKKTEAWERGLRGGRSNQNGKAKHITSGEESFSSMKSAMISPPRRSDQEKGENEYFAKKTREG